MKLIQWLLSKLFPYKINDNVSTRLLDEHSWNARKLRESEEFYGGQDGTGRY